MPMLIPATEVEFRVVDYLFLTAESPPAPATGIMEATFDGPVAGQWWGVQRVVTSTLDPLFPDVRIFAGGVSSSLSIRHSEESPGRAIPVTIDTNQPILVAGPSPVVVQWFQATPGATGIATLQAQLLERIERQAR